MISRISALLTEEGVIDGCESVRFLKMPSKAHKNSFIPVLIFVKKSDVPSFIGKIFRNPRSGGSFEAIVEKHLKVRNKLAGSHIGRALPRVFLHDFDSKFFIESYVTGKSLVPLFNNSVAGQSKTFKATVKRVMEWLYGFHTYTYSGNVMASDVDFYFADDELSTLREIFGSRYQEVVHYLSKCESYNFAVPLTYCHGDFNSYNMKMEGDTVRIYDWEDLLERGVPFLDAYHLFTVPVLFSSMDLHVCEIAFERYICADSSYKSVFVRIILDYCNKFDIDQGYASWYYLVYLLKMCLKERNRFRYDCRRDTLWARAVIKYIDLADGQLLEQRR